MREEIEAAVHFVGRVISSNTRSVSNFTEFKSELSKILKEKFQGHWYADYPGKGQGYRSIRIHPAEPLDPVLKEAAEHSKFSFTYLHIPVELTVWVDPKDVSCRFGDLKATYCTVLKDKDNKASTIDVDELLETAKAMYSRQQHFTIPDGSRHDLSATNANSKHEMLGYGVYMNGFTDSYLYPPFSMYTPWFGEGCGGGDGSTPPPLPYPPSFTSSAINTTPRKNGKNGHFRKGSNGTGRGSNKHHHHQHQHHHHHQQNGGEGGNGGSHNHNNHNNMNNTNGSTPNGSNGYWNGDRFHWTRGTRNQPQFHGSSSSSSPSQPHSSVHHHHHHQQQQQQQKQQQQELQSKQRQNSESEKEAK